MMNLSMLTLRCGQTSRIGAPCGLKVEAEAREVGRDSFSPISCNVIKNSCNISLSIYNRNVYHLLFCLFAYQSLRSLFLSVLLEYN